MIRNAVRDDVASVCYAVISVVTLIGMAGAAAVAYVAEEHGWPAVRELIEEIGRGL